MTDNDSQNIPKTFPTPEQLKKYEAVFPGAAERIVAMFEAAAIGQMNQQRTALLAWTIATVLCFLGVLAFAIYCIYIGYNQTGLAATIVAMAGVALSFWLYRFRI